MKRLKVEDISWTEGHRPIWAIQNSRGNAGAMLTDEEIDEFYVEFFEATACDLRRGKKYPFSNWNREFIEKLKKEDN